MSKTSLQETQFKKLRKLQSFTALRFKFQVVAFISRAAESFFSHSLSELDYTDGWKDSPPKAAGVAYSVGHSPQSKGWHFPDHKGETNGRPTRDR